MLSINTNLSSFIAQNSLKNSTSILNQAVERMTTGYKINHAKDNAANYSIATNMTTKIGAYMVAEENAAMGLDMLTTANEGLNLISDKLARLRDLATQASNGTYGAQSLNAINAEANALVDEINRLYNTAEYNGIKLFGSEEATPVAPIAMFAMTRTVSEPTPALPRATATENNFIDNPKTKEQSYIDNLTAVSAAGGTLTESEYKVATVDDLVELASLVNSGVDTTGKTFYLASDIDIGAFCDEKIANGEGGWIPIGNTVSYKFKGTFDGNGHVIKNLKIDRETSYTQGLFGNTTSDSEIKNVGLEEINVKGKGYIGGLVGDGSSTITNCYATGTVTGTSYIGGLVGAGGSSTITNCYTTCNVTGTGNITGGLAAQANTITNCYATGTVTGDSNTGGLVGATGSSGTITNCYATGNVTGTGTTTGGLAGSIASSNAIIINCYATGNVTGTNNTGGLVGYIQNTISITNCYATGDVTGAGKTGGLVGRLYSPNTTTIITNCYATGNITGTESKIGGLVGETNYSSINNSYATGTVNGTSDLGGLVGYNKNTTINNSAAVQADSNATVMTVEQIKSTYTPESMGFTEANGWKIVNGQPMFTWQPDPVVLNSANYIFLQVGINSGEHSSIGLELGFSLGTVDDLRMIGLDTTTDFMSTIDEMLETVSAKQTEYGAVQNRLESALEEISTQYENLVSSRSTIRDADIAEASSRYIRQQILQQASATLLATANQSPAIALQLI